MAEHIFLTFLKRILVAIGALVFLSANPALAQGSKVALIIGNSNYTNGGSLPNPSNDARLVAQAASKAGFQVTQVSDQSRDAFRASLREFRTKADTAEVAMIYYAGHGIDNNGENWLIPTDVRLADPRDLQDEAIPLTQVMDTVAGAKLRIVLLDACRNSPFADKWVSLTRSIQPGLSRIDAAEGSLVVFATGTGSTILDQGGDGNSYFAKAIAQRLPEPGLSVQLLAGKLYDDVREASSGVQRPFQASRLSGLEYYLVPKPVDRSAEIDAESLAFLRAQQANTAQAFLDYLTKFPSGKNAPAATALYSALSRIGSSAAAAPATVAVPQSVPYQAAAAQPAPYQAPAPQPAPYQAPAPQLAPYQAPPVQVVEQRPAPAPVYGQGPPAPAPIAQPTAAPVVAAAQPSVVAAPMTSVTTPPASSGAGFGVAAPQPQAAPPPAVTRMPAPSPVSTMPAGGQSASYVAPPMSRQYGAGGFPILPDPPPFSMGPYPNCKDAWLSVADPVARVETTNSCKRTFSAYKTNWLNNYRKAMNDYSAAIGSIYTNEVAPSFLDREVDRQQFYAEMLRRSQGVVDGGFLLAEYEAALAQFDRDFAAVVDSYNRASGCNGYPTPAGLAPNPNC